MSQSIRFLGLAVLTWAGVRAISLGLVPGAGALAFDLPVARTAQRPQLVPPVRPTTFPAIEPLGEASQPVVSAASYPADGTMVPYPAFAPVPVYIYLSTQAPRINYPDVHYVFQAPPAPVQQQASVEAEAIAPRAPMDPGLVPVLRVVQRTPGLDGPGNSMSFDRLQLSSWALLRQTRAEGGPTNAGALGGSQAGARLLWFPDRHLAASLRTSSPVNGQRGGEVALGIRYQPFLSVPVAMSAERRQALGQLGGRSGFAAYLEGGVYERPLPQGLKLDSYFQGGVIGPRDREWFVDGSAAVSHPVWRNISAGIAIWGAAQPRLSRLDAGPRMSVRVGRGIRVHADYRQKLVGNAEPGSGGALTVAGDF